MSDPTTPPRIRDNIDALYTVRNTKDLQIKAANFAKENPEIAQRIAKNAEDDTSLAIAIEHWKNEQARAVKMLNTGGREKTAEGNAILDSIQEQQAAASENMLRAGRFNQIASIWGKNTPEGILRFTEREIQKYNQLNNAKIQLKPEVRAKILSNAEAIQKMESGKNRDRAAAVLQKYIHEQMPPSWTQQADSLQVIAMPLNLKTPVRNIIGNSLLGVADNAAQTLATPIDKLAGKITGQRTVALPNLKYQITEGSKAAKDAAQEIKLGINLGPQTQYELANNQVFTDPILGRGERAVNYMLRVPDRFAFGGAQKDVVRGLVKANGLSHATPDIEELAANMANYRTFQNESTIAKAVIKMRDALNHIGFERNGHRFGAGNFLLRFAKTPGNIMSVGIDYSPIGLMKGLFQLARPLITKQPFDQQSFAMNLARGTIGTGVFLASYYLGKIGVITPAPEKNKSLRDLQKTEGLGGYQINTSALTRFIESGFDPEAAKLKSGDTLVSYDWAQPLSISASAGSSSGAVQNKKDTIPGATNKTASSYIEGMNTLVEQPLLTGISRLGSNFQQGGITAAAGGIVSDAPASFVPSVLSQINQLTDNTTRNTLDPNPVNQAMNRVKAKIPGLAQTLPAAVDVLGNNKERYQSGTNNPFNVLLNPAFITKYQPNATAETTLDLYKKTGETKQLPNLVGNSVQVNGQTVKLTGQQQSDLQRYNGERAVTATEMLAKNQRFQSLPDQTKVNLLSNIQSDISSAAKISVMGDRPAKISKGVQDILDGNLDKAVNDKLNNTDKGKKVKIAKGKSSRGRKSGKKGRKGKARKISISPVNFKKTIAGSQKSAASKPSGIKISSAPQVRTTTQSAQAIRIKPLKQPKVAITYGK